MTWLSRALRRLWCRHLHTQWELSHGHLRLRCAGCWAVVWDGKQEVRL